jgi:guanine deaminase
MTAGLQAFRGDLLDFAGEPAREGDAATRYIPDGLLVVENGRVLRTGTAVEELNRLPPGSHVTDYSGRLILPGFIDAHVHYPQTDVIASPGEQLLDWLENYTFPVEARFADRGHSEQTAEFFLNEMLREGITTAAVFATVHKVSVDAFFSAAALRGLRMIAGKVIMDRNCPEYLRDDPATSYEDSAELIERWHGRDRLSYAVTPRFAVTSSDEQLRLAGRLLDEYPGLFLQTHIAENREEIRWVAELFPDTDYLGVYERFNLARPRGLFAHCIHFDAPAWQRFAASGATAVHCPTSNLFLGSGLFDARLAREAGAQVALGTDVGGGTSFSMLRTMHEAYKVAQLRGDRLTAQQLFYVATRGAARALALDGNIGSFEAGREADFTVLKSDATPLMARRMQGVEAIEERLFVLMMLGDDRSIESTHVLGERVATH